MGRYTRTVKADIHLRAVWRDDGPDRLQVRPYPSPSELIGIVDGIDVCGQSPGAQLLKALR
jgi:hypothetical protein